MPVANPAPNYLKPRKLVTDLAALLCKGFSRFSEAGVSTLYEHLQEGSQTPLEIRSGMGFNKGTGPTRWGNQLNGNTRSPPTWFQNDNRPHSLGQSVEWKLLEASTTENT